MKSIPAALSLLALALAPRAERAPLATDALRFEPREGLVLKKSFEARMELELVESEDHVEVDGEEQEVGSGDYQAGILLESRLVFVDETLRAGEGRVLELARTYEELSEDWTYTFSADWTDGEEKESEESESDLEGEKVLFAWDEDGSRYEASFPEDTESDAELLEDLEGEADLLALLPEDEVETGETWAIDLSRWRTIDDPGGDLKLLAPSDEEGTDQDDAIFYENLEGEITARYEGVVEREGRRLAHVHFEGEISSSFDLEPGPSEIDGELSERMSYEIEVEGDLYWDLAAGRADEMRMTSDVRFTHETEQSAEHEGSSFEAKSTQVFQGESVLEARFEEQD